jgi:hypothetical protein
MVLFLLFVYIIKYESKEQKHAFSTDDAAFADKSNSYCMRWIKKYVRFTISLKDDSRIDPDQVKTLYS